MSAANGTEDGGVNPELVARFNSRARDYERWWAPVLAETASTLPEYVEWYAGSPPVDGATVVELGSGTGTLARAVLERWPGVQLIATDVSSGMLALTAEKLAGHGDRLRTVEAQAGSLPIPSSSADLVVSSFVLQLVPDRLAALKEAWRVLRPGGVIAYVTWIAADQDSFEPDLEFDDAMVDAGVEDPPEDDVRHNIAGDVVSARAAAAQLRKAGFRQAVAREDVLDYAWTNDSFLEYKLEYDETTLMASLSDEQRQALESHARDRLGRLKAEAFRWQTPVVFAAAQKSR